MVDAVIVDGYTDEPAGLGVPPYLDAIQRYVAGAIWTADPSWEVRYFTIDELRENQSNVLKIANKAKVVIFIAGTTVPGRYLGGSPISISELITYSRLLDKPLKILGGPAARFGFGVEGGRAAIPKHRLEEHFDLIAYGDIEVLVYQLIREKLSIERVDQGIKLKRNSKLHESIALRGAHIIKDHPEYPDHLMIEIETYRGCPRAYYGKACSFCIERHYGEPDFRSPKAIVKEVEELYKLGARHFRIGRQPDLYTYMAEGIGESEFPRPNVDAIEKLFKGIRNVAPQIRTLHIDNVNPGTIAHWQEESRKITKIIVRYHTPGDVAAMGIESADPEVIKRNNLKVTPDEALIAIRIINEIGASRGWNGLPHLLPGVNFVYGLIGETEITYKLNLEFMKRVLEEGYLVRRINIRQVMAFPGTDMWKIGERIIRRHKKLFRIYKERMRKEIDLPMLQRVAPKGTILREAYTEAYDEKKKLTYARQMGSYPLLIAIPLKLPLKRWMDFMIVDHGYRSVTGVPYPVPINRLSFKVLVRIPGIGEKRATKILVNRPFKSQEEVIKKVGLKPEEVKIFTFE